jgi:hypothetical protein
MAFDIFNIPEHIVSTDIRGKSFLFYGERKIGKTTTACRFPKPLLVATEAGYGAINKVKPIPVNDWLFFKNSVVKPLVKQAEDVKRGKLEDTSYHTIVIDTSDLLYDMCVDYICSLEGKTSLDETENKRGYKKCEKEFERTLLSLMKATNSHGQTLYSVIFISHEDIKQEKDAITKEKETKIAPTMDKRAFKVIARAVDITTYMKTVSEGDETKRYAYLRTNGMFECGNRMRYLPFKVELSYDNLKKAIIEAVEKQSEEDGVTPLEFNSSIIAEDIEYDFDELMERVQEIGEKFIEADKVEILTSVVESFLGNGARVSECTPNQAQAVSAIIQDLEEKMNEIGIK